MRIELTARVNGEFFNGGAAIEVPDPLIRAFEPLRVSEDRFLAAALGEATTEQARVVLKFREKAAKDLADTLAKFILREMQKNDTLNGYPIERLAEES